MRAEAAMLVVKQLELQIAALGPGSFVAAFRARTEAGEAGVETLLQKSSGLQWAFPRCQADGEMQFLQAQLPLKAEDFHKSPWGIWEPRPELPLVTPEEFRIILVPLLAFDGRGNRLGWGKGFYDRFLPFTKAIRVGIAFSWQESAADLPCEAHDQKLNYICTEKKVLRFQN